MYQVPDEVLSLLRAFGTEAWPARLEEYREVVQPLAQRWTADRAMARVPVTLPDGREISPSPGGQNVLVKDMARGHQAAC